MHIFTQTSRKQSFCNPAFIKGHFISTLACDFLTIGRKKKKGRISRLVPPQTCRKKQVWPTAGDEM